MSTRLVRLPASCRLALEATARQYATVSNAPAKPRTAIFFPGLSPSAHTSTNNTLLTTKLGQGVQRVGMIAPWLNAFPRTCKPFLEMVDETLQFSLTNIIEHGRNDTLTATENAQPAIMATSIMILRVLEQEFDFKTPERVDFALGHSLGEFAALVVAGNLLTEDALRLIRKRAEVMQQAAQKARIEEGGPLGMVALVCEEDRLESMIDAIHEFTGYGTAGSKSDSSHDIPAVQQVIIANINSKNQVVLSGSLARIKTLLSNLRVFGGHDPRAVTLKSDSPFHSPLMKPAQETMKRMLARPRPSDGQDMVTYPGVMPCISNISARPFETREQLKDLLARSCVETVQWWDSVKYLDKQEKVRRWIGIGPGKVGRNLVGKEVGMKGAVKGGGVWGVNDPKEVEEIMRALEETEKPYDEEAAAAQEITDTSEVTTSKRPEK